MFYRNQSIGFGIWLCAVQTEYEQWINVAWLLKQTLEGKK